MSSGMPELGSKISLISKADIRYEGRLFTVDPQECTIALSNVRSFGTEDREASFPVAPQSQIYDYILFRGSDIKDIRVVHNVNPIPNDPAIVTLSVPPPMANSGGFQQQQPPQQQGGFSHGAMLGHIGSGVSQFGNYSGMGGLPSGLAPGMGVPSRIAQESRTLSSELAEAMQGPPPLEPQQAHPPPPQPIKAEPAVSGATRKSPTMDQGTQAGKPSGVVGSNRQPSRGGGASGGDRGGDFHPREQRDFHARVEQREYQPRGEQRDFQPRGEQRDFRNNRAPGNNRQQQQQGGWHENAWSQGPPRQQQFPQQQQYQQQQHQQHQQQDGWGPQQGSRGGWRGGPRRGRGRGGNFPPRPPGLPSQLMGPGQQLPIGPPQQQQQQQQQGQPGGPKKNVLKFEGDYDFEQANTEFENLRAQLANIKLTATAAGQLSGAGAMPVPSASSTTDPTPVVSVVATVNGEEKKEVDSGNETGAGEGEAEDDGEIYYDKAKSFFDNISCEAIERSKGCSQRTDWRQERKLNSETFGVASARRGYRGRGGYYRGGGMYRGGGGYRGGFRGRGGYNRHPGQQQGGPMGPPQQQGGQNRATATAGGK